MNIEAIQAILFTASARGVYPEIGMPEEQAAIKLANDPRVREWLPEHVVAQVPGQALAKPAGNSPLDWTIGSGGDAGWQGSGALTPPGQGSVMDAMPRGQGGFSGGGKLASSLANVSAQGQPPSYPSPGAAAAERGGKLQPAFDALGSAISGELPSGAPAVQRYVPPGGSPAASPAATGSGLGPLAHPSQLRPDQIAKFAEWNNPGLGDNLSESEADALIESRKAPYRKGREDQAIGALKDNLEEAGTSKPLQQLAMQEVGRQISALRSSGNPEDADVADTLKIIYDAYAGTDSGLDREKFAYEQKSDAAKFGLDKDKFAYQQSSDAADRAYTQGRDTVADESAVRKERQALRERFLSSLGDGAGGYADASGYLPGMGPDSPMTKFIQGTQPDYAGAKGAPLPSVSELSAALAAMGADIPSPSARPAAAAPPAAPVPSAPVALQSGGGNGSSTAPPVPWEEVRAYIEAGARARGLNPAVPVEIAWRESANHTDWYGDRAIGGSYGPFQLYMGGGMGNTFKEKFQTSPSDFSTWKQQVDFSLDSMAGSGSTRPWSVTHKTPSLQDPYAGMGV